MTSKIEQFRALHVPGKPLVLYNIWDAGSARAVAEAGAKAIATGSYGVAEANGFKDGETLPLDIVLENLRRILTVTDLPVTIDMEAGYGDTPAEVGRSVGKLQHSKQFLNSFLSWGGLLTGRLHTNTHTAPSSMRPPVLNVIV